MKVTLPLMLGGMLLAACSPQPANEAGPVDDSANGVADVALAEGSAAGADANAAADAAVSDTAMDNRVASPVADAKTQRDYIGKWVGVEGMVMTVAAKPGGGVTIDNQWDLDNRGTFDGSVTAEGLRFVRNGVAETAIPTNGDATGLKWLAGKTDCLTVKSGEGYCRE